MLFISKNYYIKLSQIFVATFLVLSLYYIDQKVCQADVIMMGDNGMPSIIENDNFPDMILMPGMQNLIMNDDLVL